MKNRIFVFLDEEEYEALWKISSSDLRTPTEELRHLLRQKMDIQRRKQSREIAEKKVTTNENKI